MATRKVRRPAVPARPELQVPGAVTVPGLQPGGQGLAPGQLVPPIDLEELERRRQAAENFAKIEHIVVMMLENRSFDHLLGYLSLPPKLGGLGRTDVGGLKGGEHNFAEGLRYDVNRLTDPEFPACPPHGHLSVRNQLGLRDFTDGETGPVLGPNGGFARAFLDAMRSDGVSLDPGLVMGYYTAAEVPVFDFLAREFTVCDHWFSSFPGPTWPNRMFFYGGTSNGITTNPDHVVAPYRFADEREMPKRLLTDLLDELDVDWKSYSHDFAWIRFFPGKEGGLLGNRLQKMRRFFRDCEDGKLPALSYVDPNFTDLGPDANSTDDLPPCDVRQAQRGVREVYEALRSGPGWSKTLFVVTYDEHGGFYDHVPPAAVFDEREGTFRKTGARVPALVASPYVPRGSVSKTVFDHTSVAKTVLKRFGPADASAPILSLRTVMANSLGGLLTSAKPRFSVPAAPAVPAASRRLPRTPTDLAQAIAAVQESMAEPVA